MKELPVYHGDREVGSFGMTEQAEYYIAYSEDWKKMVFLFPFTSRWIQGCI